MSDKAVSVGLRFDGDAKGAQDSVGQIRKGLTDLKADSDKIKLLDGESVAAKELSIELKKLEEETKSLASASARVAILDSAIASADRYKVKLTEANAEVRKIQATLSEAYNSGADKSLIKSLEKELVAAERAATSAGVAVQGSTANIVRLNLAAGEAGITTGNLAAKKIELAETYQRLTGAIDQQSTAVKREAEYQAYLAQESERVAAAEKRVAESGFIEHQRQSAIQAQKAAEYTNFWAAALDKADAAEKKAERSSEALNTSFSKLGIRTAAQIEADIQAINQDLLKLASNTKLSGSEFDRAFVAGQTEIKKLRSELTGTAGNIDIVRTRTDMLLSAMGKIGLAFSGVELARQFVKVNIELENIERTFTAITGSSALAAKELEFVRGVADRLGIDTISASKAFAQLSASTKGTGAEGKVTRDIFESVARAMSVAGKSSADTEGALQALAQMASKGVISMEEMRQQLGERLPGAMAAAAKGLGITTSELNELIESGKLTAEELFPALKKGLDDLYGAAGPAGAATETLAQEIAHAKNTVDQMYKSIGDSGIIKGMGSALEGLSAAAVVVSNVLVTTGKTIGTFFAAFASGDIGLRGFNENAKKAFAEIATEAQDKLVKAAMHNKVLEASLDESGKKALAAARAQQTNAAAAEGAGQAALALSADWTTLNVAYGKLEKTTEAAVKQSEAVAEAKKAETSASVALANAFGTEAEKLAAQSDAGKVNAEATAAVAERKKELYAVTKANIEALQNEIDLQVTKATPAQEKVIADLQKIAEARKTDAEKAIAQADATRLAAAQASVASEAYADNSARLGELKIAYDQAREAVAALRKEKANGADVTAQLTAAELAAARAAALYRDAQKDLEEKIKAVAAAKTASNSVEQAGIRLAIEQQRTIYEVAKAKGDEQGATKALLEIKRLEIELARLTAEAKKAEAEAGRLLALAKIEEIRSSGQMTDAKRAEITALEASIKVKEIEAQIAGVMAERLKEVTQATRDSGNAAGDAAGGHDRLAGSLDRVATSANTARESVSSYQQMVAKGMSQAEISNKLSDQSTSDTEKSAGVVKRNVSTDTINWRSEAIRRGASSDQASEIADQMADEIEKQMDEVRRSYQGATSADPYEYRTRINGAYEQALTAVMDNVMGGKAQLGGSSTAAGQQGQQTSVTINLNGRATNVNVASAADANALVGMLKELESSASRASL